MRQGDLTQGPVMKTMLRFAVPMILGNLLQQCYNVADTLIVGRFLGPDALAAVGSSFTLMTFLTSILLGLCMGSGAVFSIRFGQRTNGGLKEAVFASFVLIAGRDRSAEHSGFCGHGLYSSALPAGRRRGAGPDAGISGGHLLRHSPPPFCTIILPRFCVQWATVVAPLAFLAVSAVLNIALDLWFVLGLSRGVAGAAEATVISQYVSGVGLALYTWRAVSRPAACSARTAACGWLRMQRDRRLLLPHLRAAVCDEPGYSDGTGPGEQLWPHCNGGLCRRCEDRRLCLHPRAGFRQRLFHLYRAELRRGAGMRASVQG